MSNTPVQEILDFGGQKGIGSFSGASDTVISGPGSAIGSSGTLNSPQLESEPSHLSSTSMRASAVARSRSDSSWTSKDNVKRVKHNIQGGSEESSLKQLEQARSSVHEVILTILEKNQLNYGYSYYYQKVEAICKYKHAEQSSLAEYCKTHIQRVFEEDIHVSIAEVVNDDSLNNHQFVVKYLHIYDSWEARLRSLSKVCLYLDRSYLLPHPNKKVVLELGLDLFIDSLLASSTTEGKLTIQKYTRFMNQCLIEGHDDVAAMDTLSRFTKMLIKLNFKKKIKVNNEIIDQCVTSFTILKQEWLNDHSTYIHSCLKSVSKVVTLFKTCGQPKVFNEKLLLKLKWVTIFSDFDHIIKLCLPSMLENEQGSQLSMMFKLCELTPKEYSLESIPIFVNQWGKLIHERVNSVIENDTAENSGSIISSLVEMFEHYRNLVSSKFKDNEKFEFEVRHSFSKSINLNRKVNVLIISQLCKNSDAFFKRKLPTNYQEFEQRFMTIFKFLNNKNDFIINYKSQLARRLLMSRNVLINMEKKLVDSIIQIVGETDDTMGLKIMFKDLTASQTTYTNVQNIGPPTTEFSALILEKKHWPEIPKPDVLAKLPPEFLDILQKFDKYHKSSDDKFKNHRLDWGNYNLHQLVIVGHFNSGDYELNVNLLQALVIILFNNQESVPLSDLIQATGMDTKLLRRIINSLSDKYRILIEEEDIVRFNNDFSDKSKKLKIPLPRDREGNSVTTATEKVDIRSRDTEIRSVLVRIMKVDTKMAFTDLISKALDIINAKGPVSIQEIKSNIEFLITKEYVSRDVDNRTLTYIP